DNANSGLLAERLERDDTIAADVRRHVTRFGRLSVQLNGSENCSRVCHGESSKNRIIGRTTQADNCGASTGRVVNCAPCRPQPDLVLTNVRSNRATERHPSSAKVRLTSARRISIARVTPAPPAAASP